MSPLTSVGHYRVVLASEIASDVAVDLIDDPVPYLAIRRDAGWVVRVVDAALIRDLARSGTVGEVLRADAPAGDHSVKLLDLMKKDRSLESLGPSFERVVVDKSGAARLLIAGDAEPDASSLYPIVTTKVKSVAPDDVVEVDVMLETAAPEYGVAELELPFVPGEESITLHANVSSASFAMPDGTAWTTDFTVKRDRSTTPGSWSFKAIARGDARRYKLKVTFSCRGQTLGNVALTLPRTGTQLPASTSSTGAMTIPPIETTPVLVLSISEDGATFRRISAYQGGKTLVDNVKWNIAADAYFGELQRAKTLDKVKQIGIGVYNDLPPAIRTLLTEASDAPLSITGVAPYAPFEIANIPVNDGELLGVLRPVMRWNTDVSEPAMSSVSLAERLCVRPTYTGNDHLPSAVLEETYFDNTLPGTRKAKTEAELVAMLAKAFGAIHFAGHAQTNPPILKLEGSNIPPAFFAPTSKLMRARPFIFLNGCEGGAGRVAAPSEQGNMVKAFLCNGASCMIAPVIRVDSRGALEVATTFYDRIRAGDSVGAAMHQVRKKALGADDDLVGTYFSYLAFGASGFQLVLP